MTTGQEGQRAKVVVIGAGVSGCACAAVLAARGVAVTVFNSSLDSVCHPAYGPLVSVGDGGWQEVAATLALLPRPLRAAWVDCSQAVEGEARFFCIDARRLSVEAKRALECMPGLEFRQGLIADLRLEKREDASGWGLEKGDGVCGEPALQDAVSGVRVVEREVVLETVFGEVVRAAAAVIAVGLNLGGRVELGEIVLPGGRYGETPGEGVLVALKRLGVKLEETCLDVGPRISRGAISPQLALGRMVPCLGCHGEGRPVGQRAAGVKELESEPRAVRPTAQGEGTRSEGEGGRVSLRRWVSLQPLSAILGAAGLLESGDKGTDQAGWPVDYPPSPYLSGPACSEPGAALLGGGVSGIAEGWTGPAETTALLVPDGAATGEFYCPAGEDLVREVGEDLVGEGGGPARTSREGVALTRRDHRVKGFVVRSLSSGGRLLTAKEGVIPLWVAGRAAGASGYLESLASGARVGMEVAAFVGETGGRGGPEAG